MIRRYDPQSIGLDEILSREAAMLTGAEAAVAAAPESPVSLMTVSFSIEMQLLTNMFDKMMETRVLL